MNFIVAVARDWGIGYKNELLLSIPDDMRYFRETTRDAVLVMGQKTLESFPGGKPLKGRVNIVLSDDPDFGCEGTTIVRSPDELFEVLKGYDTEKTFVIGGGSVYRLMLPYCKRAHITKMDIQVPADTFIPNLDELPNWSVERESEVFTHEGVRYSFVVYVNDAI